MKPEDEEEDRRGEDEDRKIDDREKRIPGQREGFVPPPTLDLADMLGREKHGSESQKGKAREGDLPSEKN